MRYLTCLYLQFDLDLQEEEGVPFNPDVEIKQEVEEVPEYGEAEPEIEEEVRSAHAQWVNFAVHDAQH